MKKKNASFSKILPAVEKAIAQKGFKTFKINSSKDSASFAIQGLKFEKLFFQILNLTEERPGFAVVEIFVSNLSVTEKWVDIEVSLDVLPDFIGEMMKNASIELNKNISVEKLEGVAKKIEAMEPKLAKSIHELHRLEDVLADASSAPKAKTQALSKMAKVENACLKSEIEISRLAFQYFTNLIESIEPFFFNALMTVKWASKK